MREFKKKYSRRQELVRFFIGLGAVAIMLALTISSVRAAWSMYGKFSEASAGDAAANLNLEQLKVQEAHVSATVAQLQTQRGVEAQIRENYGLALPGEGEIDLVQSSTSTVASTTPPAGFWTRLWHMLFPW